MVSNLEKGILLYKFCSEFIDSLNNYCINIKNFNDNGNLFGEYNELNHNKIGSEILYYENGQHKRIGHYNLIQNNGKSESVKDGIFVSFHQNGAIKAKVEFLKGKEIGKSYFYDESGILKCVKVIGEFGEEFNIINSDTVNFTDKFGHKQGKWISFSRFTVGSDCDAGYSELKFMSIF